MRKFPKLLAVVLAVAIVICPAMCLTSMAAEPNGTYAFDANVVASGAYDTATLHIDSETGYLVAVAKAELTGYALSSDENAVTAVDNNAENLSVESKVSGTILTMLVKRVDVTDLSPITAATISIKVVKDDSTQHYITLTHIQAADQGTVGDDGTLGDENLLTFPCANNNENGLINQVEAAEKGLNVVAGTNCSHDNATTTTVVEPTCTEPGEEKHTCPDCGAEWTTPIDALGHDGVVTSISDTQHAEVCSRCGVTIDGTTADHTFDEKNTCTECGYKKQSTEPVVDTSLTFRSASLGYGASSLQMAFRVTNTVLNSYADMQLVIIPQKYDSATLNIDPNPQEIVKNKSELAAAGATMKSYTYTDIQLYELGLDINYMLRAYDESGNLVAVSETFTISPATYLKNTFETQASNAKLRTLITDTLIVGNESVKGMAANYADSDLAKAPSIIDGFDTSEATATIDSYNEVYTNNSFNADFTDASSAKHYVRKPSVSIGKAPYITYRIKDSGSVLDLSKLSFKVTYTQVAGDGTETPYDKTFTVDSGAITRNGTLITFKFDQIGIQDGNQDVLVEITYDGEKVYSVTYSVESYLGTAMSNPSIGSVATALIKLGISFRAYSAK